MKEGNDEGQFETKYLKMYELNDEGLRLYAKYKKEQLFTTLKYSFYGTIFGATLAYLLFEMNLKKTYSRRKDLMKTAVLLSCCFFFTFHGIHVSSDEFRRKQATLADLYGKEIK